MPDISRYRWWVVALLALATALNYLDRQTLPVVISEIQQDIRISDTDYSRLQFCFLLAYGLMYAGGGRLVDVVGSRVGYLLVMVWWSAATMLHGLAGGVTSLGIARFLLGLGEGGGFPASAKVVSEWFPPRERSYAFGIFNTGSSVGAVVAPPLMALIVSVANWRWAFFVTGFAGFAWAAIWWLVYKSPPEGAAEADEEIPSPDRPDQPRRPKTVPWAQLLHIRQVQGLLAAKFLSDSAWFFLIFWLPKYLADVRGLNIKEIGYYAWIPYAFAGFGSYFGGWIGSHLIRRGYSVDASRKITLAVSACLMPSALGITSVPLGGAIVLFSILMLAHQFWSTIVQTLATDLFPSSAVGSVAGLMGATGSFGGMIFNLLVGELLTRTQSYFSTFCLTGFLHIISFVLIVKIVGRIQPVSRESLETSL